MSTEPMRGRCWCGALVRRMRLLDPQVGALVIYACITCAHVDTLLPRKDGVRPDTAAPGRAR